MLLRFSLSILVPVVSWLFGYGILVVISAVSGISSSVILTWRKCDRASSFQILTLVLLLASLVLGKFKGIGHPGALQLAIGVGLSPILSIRRSGLKRILFTSPFWFFIAWAVGDIFAVRYGNWGYLLSLVVVPIAWRDSKLGEVQKAQ